MIVASCLYKYFPFGGLQRDFMRIASTVAARGHHVRVYTQSWEGDCPKAFELIQVPVKSHTNHGRNAEYYARATFPKAAFPPLRSWYSNRALKSFSLKTISTAGG